MSTSLSSSIRKTSQALAPVTVPNPPGSDYNLFPAFPIGGKKFLYGYAGLAAVLKRLPLAVIDGYIGVAWQSLRDQLAAELASLGISARFVDVCQALHSPQQIEALLQPYLGGDDPLFGRRFSGDLSQFFDAIKLAELQPDESYALNVLYGCGAALAGWQASLFYADLPKNEIQFRMRAGSIQLLGSQLPADTRSAYKRLYFVDWPVLNRHKAELLADLDWYLDEQRPGEPLLISGSDLRSALDELSRSAFRARPWFEPGPWGGQWIGEHVPQLPANVPNYAWSFELISPENGILLESGGLMLEISFDLLLMHASQAVLGKFADFFGSEFPIRFDFLDTFAGGNLSIQCHPRADYIRQHFGEDFTQDEAYYVLDCQAGARIYLGFQQDINPQAFRLQLENSAMHTTPVDIDRYVYSVNSHRHDLFLIPAGTIHGSGVNNLILEISATPYIFTFKMYDWLRLDLDGNPRPLNIERAFENLDFERKGEKVQKELVSVPKRMRQGDDWSIFHLPTHSEHFYDVVRLEFDHQLEWQTSGSPQVMNLVEGGPITVQTPNGRVHQLNYAETLVLPAAADRCRLVNLGSQAAKLVSAFLKPDWFSRPEHSWLNAGKPQPNEH